MIEETYPDLAARDHLMWVRTRLTLERDLRDTTTQGFALMTAGFGSFAIFDGLAVSDQRDALPLAFALTVTGVGVVVVALALRHYRKMTAWVDVDEFQSMPAPPLPDERRSVLLAVGAITIGVISFIALLVIR